MSATKFVRVFTGVNEELVELQNKVNQWIFENEVSVVDIKYEMDVYEFDYEVWRTHSILVIYEAHQPIPTPEEYDEEPEEATDQCVESEDDELPF